MGKSDRSPRRKHHNSHRDDERRRSKERSRHRSYSRSRSPEEKRRRRHDDSPVVKKEVKEEVLSDRDSPPRRRRDDRDRHSDRRRDDRERHSERNHDDRERNRDRRDRENTESRRRNRSNSIEDKKYGLQKNSEEKERWGKPEPKKEEEPVIEKEKVNLGVSGKLAEDTNTYRGVVIKYNEPPEAKMPNARWRLYPFKGEEALKVLYVHRQSAYLIGRDHKICDIPVDHPSCSKQHAVLQYRSMPFVRDDGTKARRIVPYIIDLGSANGTYLNEEKIDPQRYIEIKEKDMLKFGFSTREYVVMKEREIADSEIADAGGDGESD